MKHLSDDEIQAYLDGAPPALDRDLKVHLETCAACQNAVGQYKTLYAGLADDTAYDVPSDLAQTVVSRLGLATRKGRLALPADIALVAGAIVAMVVVVVNFLDVRPLLNALLALRAPLVEYASSPFESARTYLIGLNHTLVLGLAGIAILIFMAALDAALRRSGSVFVRHPRR